MSRSHPKARLVRDIRRLQQRGNGPVLPLPPRPARVVPRPAPLGPRPLRFEIIADEPTVTRTVREDRRIRALHWIDCAIRMGSVGFFCGLVVGVMS